MSETKKTPWLTVQNLKDGGLAALLIAAMSVLIDKGCRELPTPAPAPQPSPVGPVDPVPVADTLESRLRAAYASDSTPRKSEALEALRHTYQRAAAWAVHPEYLTAGHVSRAVQIHAPAGLTELRRMLAAEVFGSLPVADEPLTGETRQAIRAAYERAAKLLDGVQNGY